ncbi:MAG: hypothetical protein HQK97_12780, partial [Nitrospirae bacterium]|nr:hypothetical protein [Nitrospirota bacterium]
MRDKSTVLSGDSTVAPAAGIVASSGIHIVVDASWSKSFLQMADELIGISKATETEFLELG